MQYTALGSETHFRMAPAKVATDGIVIGVISNNEPDAHNTVLLPEGGDYEHYLRSSGSISWEHSLAPDRGSLPVGICERIDRTATSLIGTVRFRDDAFSRDVYECYKDGSVRGFSVEFIPKQGTPPTRQEIRENPSWGDVKEVYRKWTLRGLSATATPSCPGAVAIQVRSALHAPKAPSKPLTRAQERQIADVIKAVTSPEHIEFMMNIARERRALETKQSELAIRAACLRRGVSSGTLDAVLGRKLQEQSELNDAEVRSASKNCITGYY